MNRSRDTRRESQTIGNLVDRKRRSGKREGDEHDGLEDLKEEGSPGVLQGIEHPLNNKKNTEGKQTERIEANHERHRANRLPFSSELPREGKRYDNQPDCRQHHKDSDARDRFDEVPSNGVTVPIPGMGGHPREVRSRQRHGNDGVRKHENQPREAQDCQAGRVTTCGQGRHVGLHDPSNLSHQDHPEHPGHGSPGSGEPHPAPAEVRPKTQTGSAPEQKQNERLRCHTCGC